MTTSANVPSDQFFDLDEARKLAEQHAKSLAHAEVLAVQASLKDLYPSNTPISIQLLQPIDGGRLVDVGPRPAGAVSDLISQSTMSGVTGRLVLEGQFLNHFFPSDDRIGDQEGAFPRALVSLECSRYPNTGNWKNDAPPPDARIRQVPLLPLPLTMQPRKVGVPYRYADFGVTYTVTAARPTRDQDAQVKRLSLYALRAGEIVQRIRYRTICGGKRCLSHLTECRLLVSRVFPEKNRWDESYRAEHGETTTAKIETDWRDNRDGGICRLVGTLILHHHWWFPFDPIAFRILQLLTGSRETTEALFWSHLCVPPPHESGKTSSTEDRPLSDMLHLLCEDIGYIVASYRRTPLSQIQKSRIDDAVLAMLLQLCGDAEYRYTTEDLNEGIQLHRRDTRAWGRKKLGMLAPGEAWAGTLIDRLSPNTECICNNSSHQKICSIILPPIITESMTKTPEYGHCQYVLGLLAPGEHPAFHVRNKDTRGTGFVFANCPVHGEVLWVDRNGEVPHFLYWHTRAMHAWKRWRNGKGHGSTSN